jgi:hypothetical protein
MTEYTPDGRVDYIDTELFASRLLLVEIQVPAVMDAHGEVIGVATDVESLTSHLMTMGGVQQVVFASPGLADEANMSMGHPFAHQLVSDKEFRKIKAAYEQVLYLRECGWTVTPPPT